MTKEEAKKAAEVMLAYADGKKVELLVEGNGWMPFTDGEPRFDWSNCSYRIKAEPTYRPFKDAEECWQEMQKHQPFGWVKYKTDDGTVFYDQVGCLYFDDEEKKWVKTSICSPDPETMKESLENYTFADDTPFGVLEEEV